MGLINRTEEWILEDGRKAVIGIKDGETVEIEYELLADILKRFGFVKVAG